MTRGAMIGAVVLAVAAALAAGGCAGNTVCVVAGIAYVAIRTWCRYGQYPGRLEEHKTMQIVMGGRIITLGALSMLSAAMVVGCTMGQSKNDQDSAQQRSPLLDDAVVVAYVSAVGGRVAEAAEQSQLRFFISDSAVINAYAKPGGRVLITRGLLEQLDSEAQLAGVLAHEIGHHAQASSLLRPIGQAQEEECDELALRWMVKSGYDPGELVVVIEILAAREAPPIGYLSNHPSATIRITKIEQWVRKNHRAEACPDQIPGKEAYQQNVLQRLRHLSSTGCPKAG